MKTVLEQVAAKVGIPPSNFLVAELSRSVIHKIFQLDDGVSAVFKQDVIFAFEITPSSVPADDVFIFVYNRYSKIVQYTYSSYSGSSSYTYTYCEGVPHLIQLSRASLTPATLLESIKTSFSYVSVFVCFPFIDWLRRTLKLPEDAPLAPPAVQDAESDDELEKAYQANEAAKSTSAASPGASPDDAPPEYSPSSSTAVSPNITTSTTYALNYLNQAGSTVTGPVTVASLASIPTMCFVGIDWVNEATLKQYYDVDVDEKTDDAPAEKLAEEGSGTITLDECIELYYKAEKLSEHNMWYVTTWSLFGTSLHQVLSRVQGAQAGLEEH